jgi:hypothetical protein
MARPVWTPTDAQRRQAETMAAYGIPEAWNVETRRPSATGPSRPNHGSSSKFHSGPQSETPAPHGSPPVFTIGRADSFLDLPCAPTKAAVDRGGTR